MVLVSCLLAGSFLRAQTADAGADLLPPLALKRLSVEELMAQQVVSVSRKPEALGEAASDVFLIRGQSVTTTGATSLPELLRLATNLFVAQSSSSQWAINARGFVRADGFSNKLLVMIYGRSVYSPLFSNVFWDATSVFLPDVQQVEVISGPAGATWGANAVNGVINIQTKPAQDTLGGLLVASTGSQETDLGLRYGVKLGERGALRIYAQETTADASLANTGSRDDFDSWKSRGGGFRADWRGDAATELTVSGDIFSGRYRNGPSPDTVNNGANLLARWSRDWSADSQLWVRLYQDYEKRDSLDDLTEVTNTTDLEFQHRVAFAHWQEILWGANYRWIADDVTQTNGFAILPAELHYHIGSVFAQHQLVFAGDALRLTTGLRLEHNYFSGWEDQPSIRLAWLRPEETLWLSCSRATRIPSRLETGYYYPETPPYLVVGGGNVVAETVQAYEMGWRSQPTRDVSFTATLFYNDYDHLRSVEPTTPVTFANGVAGRSYGLEFFADWQVTAWWRLRLGGFRTNQETWLRPGGADIEKGMGESSFPKYQAQLRNTFHLGKAVTLWTALRRVAAVPTFESQVAGMVPAYTDLDLNLDWTLRPDITLAFTGRNLLEPSHPELGAFAVQRQIPRSLQAQLRCKF